MKDFSLTKIKHVKGEPIKNLLNCMSGWEKPKPFFSGCLWLSPEFHYFTKKTE